jgi:polar amino acid transport system substrate-binding protein
MMKKGIFAGLAILLMGGMVSAGGSNQKTTAPATGSSAGTTATQAVLVRAATGGSPRPFTYVNEDNVLVGHNIELVQAIFARLPQYRLELEVTDFPSIFAGLDSDRYQIGVNNFAMNEERKEKYLFSDPIFKNRYIAAVSASNTSLGDNIRTLGDLAGKSTANSVGTNMATAIENYNQANPDRPIKQNYTEANLLATLQEVESGKWDFNLIDKPMFEVYQREFNLQLKGIELGEEVSGTLMQTPYSYLLVSTGNDQLAADINRALREVIADGTSKKINEKYFGSDYSPDLQ